MNDSEVALWGTLGTWLAVLLALIALVGIVVPLLVFKTAYTTKNKAINAVRDVNQDFITKGYGFSPDLRLFRKVKIPNLVASIDGKEPVIPNAEVEWEPDRVRGTSCRTGWSRICRLIQSYNSSEKLSINDGLVIWRGRTWLPMSRYWILTLGLLGRYGRREDGGKRVKANIRRDLKEERTLLNESDEGSDEESSEDAVDYSESDYDMASSDNGRSKGFSNSSMIAGITGSLRKLKFSNRQNDSDCGQIKSPLSFILHNRHERGDIALNVEANLASMYWLAAGFLPGLRLDLRDSNSDLNLSIHIAGSSSTGACPPLQIPRRDFPSTHIAISLENPSPNDLHEEESSLHNGDASPAARDIETPRLFTLKSTRERPRSIRLATEAFGITSTKILYWKDETKASKAEYYPRRDDLRGCVAGTISPHVAHHIRVDGVGGKQDYITRTDAEMLVSAFLELEWTPAGYLIWKHREVSFFTLLLLRTAELYPLLLPRVLIGLKRPGNTNMGQRPDNNFLEELKRWKNFTKFNAVKTNDLLQLDDMCRGQSELPDEVFTALAMLLILNRAFQDKVKILLASLSLESSAGDENIAELEVHISVEVKNGVLWWGDELFEFGDSERAKVIPAEEENVIATDVNVEVYTDAEGAKTAEVIEVKEKVTTGEFAAEDINTEKVEVSQDELLIVALSTATKCALWTSALDSRPLMEFVGGLRRVAHVG